MTQQVLRWIGFVMTIAPGLVIAARVRPRLMGWAFVGPDRRLTPLGRRWFFGQ